MNDRPQPPPEGLQSKEEIARIVTESRKAGTAAFNGLQETDDYIDDAMDSYEASLDYNE
ncbi:Snf1-like ser/thr protein kinase [Monoraphidium neglectum]|uniref:Snf1-like ser/thr protein kinase n=1 Tax=Monoraphidium neglectum TaxID=145388 RepID=A0A0D2MA17_9CHLO|nr:Snf1-like ser/thr protein kinase [Monoraphidium neglectum]KIZ00130.1 Snf1-like ser/thr protein kinase [Monoraphidium neglectum]|eukprot:XP_013899149.1 Snf1-like ser/thr protein kinase [Monoraphidium neglectum]